jgi:hypothetical protein
MCVERIASPTIPVIPMIGHTSCTRRALAVMTFVVAAAWNPANAQSHFRSGVGLSGGVAQFDMSGTGTAPFAAVRLEHEFTSWLVADGALGVLRPDEQLTQRRVYLVPEAQLQVQHAFGGVRPYFGVGMGMLKSVSGPERNYAIFSGATGARVALRDAVDLRGELRVTGQSATLAQWTLGLARRF